MATTGTQKLMC